MDILGSFSDPSQEPERRMARLSAPTVSWTHPIAIEEEIFSKLKTVAIQLPSVVGGDEIGGGLGKPEEGPVFTNEEISFSGVSPKDGDSFYFPRISGDLIKVIDPTGIGTYERMCRTYNYPYTVAVIGFLYFAQSLAAVHGIRVSTDIDSELHAKGLELYDKLNKQGVQNVL